MAKVLRTTANWTQHNPNPLWQSLSYFHFYVWNQTITFAALTCTSYAPPLDVPPNPNIPLYLFHPNGVLTQIYAGSRLNNVRSILYTIHTHAIVVSGRSTSTKD